MFNSKWMWSCVCPIHNMTACKLMEESAIMGLPFHYSIYHGFIQAILMLDRQHKKLNVLIELLNSIFIKCFLKHLVVELAFKINNLTKFLLFSATYFSSKCKKVKIFQMLNPLNPHQGSTMNTAEITAPCKPQLHFTTFKNSIFVQKQTLVKLLG